MKPTITEWRFLVYAFLSVMFLVTIHVFHPQISSLYNPKNFLSFHTALELFAISISFSIFFYGWWKYEETKSGKLLMLSMLFLIVGLVDLVHTLTFNGMPMFFGESSVPKATWFWIIARTFEATFMVMLLLLPERSQRVDLRFLWLLVSLGFVIGITFFVFHFEMSLPVLVIEGQGTTVLKNGIEYFVCFLRIVSMVIALLFYNDRKKPEFLYMALAFTLLFLSELTFTVYQNVFDIDNFFGHIYKGIGYFFIMKAFYLSIKKGTLSENQYHLHQEFQLSDIIHEHPGIIFTVKRVGDTFIHRICDGELLTAFDLTPEKVLGKTTSEIFATNAKIIDEYYRSAWESGTEATFKMNFNDKRVLISLKPLFRDGEVVEILGNVIDFDKFEKIDKKNQKLQRYISIHQ